jgi:hypothetical protein
VLLLTVVPSAESDPNIKPLRGVPSKRPPAVIVDSDEAPTLLAPPVAKPRSVALVIVAVAVLLWILLLIWLRLAGRG